MEIKKKKKNGFLAAFGGFGKSYLEELNANDGEHELQQTGDEYYVSDSLYGYDDALYYVLRAFFIIVSHRFTVIFSMHHSNFSHHPNPKFYKNLPGTYFRAF